MHFECLHDRDEIETFLRRDPALQLYALGDLDAFFWKHTLWMGLKRGRDLRALALLYVGFEAPTLLALCPAGEVHWLRLLLEKILAHLPRAFYAHLTPGLHRILEARYLVQPRGAHYRMTLERRSAARSVPTREAFRLSEADREEILELYDSSYPGNWFDDRMLETGRYFGIRRDGRLASVAGVHTFSERYRVAALGNITTRLEHRRQGLARTVTAALLKSLVRDIEHIGLNVAQDNEAAIDLYKGLGFRITAPYEEFMVGREEPITDRSVASENSIPLARRATTTSP